jgi:hypothetical protein
MLVPHEFKREGDGYVLQYNPEALELFVMQKVFTKSSGSSHAVLKVLLSYSK